MNKLLAISLFLFSANILQAAIAVDFYGHIVQIRHNRLSTAALHKVSDSDLSKFEATIQTAELQHLTEEIDSLAKVFNLDDVGNAQLVARVSKALYPDNNRRQFVRWRILKEQKYQVVLAYNGQEISTFGVLGFSPSNAVYIMLKGEKFTNLDFKDYRLMGKRSIYGNPLAGRAMFLNPSKKPAINKKIKSRKLVFTYDNKRIEISARGNESLMEYIRDLPTLDFNRVYIDYGVSDELRNSLFRDLNVHMQGMSVKNKLSFLLKFTQQTFNYASDQTNYGVEKYNFPEETIFEPYSDCDDRVLLLACLYKELLGLNSVALLFSKQDHVAMAVHVPASGVGGSFKYEGKSYYVCEPTGANYLFGQSAYPLPFISKVYKLH